MGHLRLGEIPRTRDWQDVVCFLQNGADAEQIAHAAIRAAEDGLRAAPKDRGVVEAVYLLMRLPQAARDPDYPAPLWDDGLRLPEAPTLMELITAFSDAIDVRLANQVGRSDLGEMAQMAAVETLVHEVGSRIESFFAVGAIEVHAALHRLHTVKNFGACGRWFVGRLTFKCLDYYLSRVLADFTGGEGRFATLAQQEAFTDALETHCHEAAFIVERFTGEWRGKENYEMGEVTREAATGYIGGAMNKLIDELRMGAGLDATD